MVKWLILCLVGYVLFLAGTVVGFVVGSAPMAPEDDAYGGPVWDAAKPAPPWKAPRPLRSVPGGPNLDP